MPLSLFCLPWRVAEKIISRLSRIFPSSFPFLVPFFFIFLLLFLHFSLLFSFPSFSSWSDLNLLDEIFSRWVFSSPYLIRFLSFIQFLSNIVFALPVPESSFSFLLSFTPAFLLYAHLKIAVLCLMKAFSPIYVFTSDSSYGHDLIIFFARSTTVFKVGSSSSSMNTCWLKSKSEL